MSKYREVERKKAIKLMDDFFKDPGQGDFLGKPRDFVLSDRKSNLWSGIREDSIAYFKTNSIKWWKGDKDDPTGHLLSSQIACINHLYFIRQRKDLATAILKKIDTSISEALIMDDGYVEFEVIGKSNHLSEKSWQRGANATSVDAAMIGKTKNNKVKLFMIEWKYTEEYQKENKYIPSRKEIYDKLIIEDVSPFKKVECETLYFEPFYQLMRQTLLANKMVINRDYDCEEFMHLHIIPDKNKELTERITSPKLRELGTNLSEVWKKILKKPSRYLVLSPEKLLEPCVDIIDSKSWITYLKKRYW